MLFSFHNSFVVYWQRTIFHQRQKKETCKISIHDSLKSGLAFIKKYYSSIPQRPYPEEYYIAITNPQLVNYVEMRKENLLPSLLIFQDEDSVLSKQQL